MRIFVRRAVAVGCVGLGLGCSLAPCAWAQKPTAPEPTAKEDNSDKLIEMDFQDVDLGVLVKFISNITGKNFIVDDRVKGKVTVISPSKISVDEAYMVFQSVLQVKGFTTVPAGPITKIIPAKEAKTTTLPTIIGSTAPTDQFVTRLVPLKKVDAASVVPIIQPLVSPDGLLASYDPTNTIILIDTAANTDRLVQLLYQLDVEGFERGIDVIKLTHAFAEDIADKLAQVLEEGETPGATATNPAQAAAAARVRARRGIRSPATAGAVTGGTATRSFKLVPDERTNSLIVIAGPIEMRRIKELVARLDVPLPLGTGRIHVYYLKHANAEELVAVLADLIGGGGGGGGGGFGGFNRGGVGGGRFGGSRTGSFGRGTGGSSSFGGSSFGGSSFGGSSFGSSGSGGGFASGRLGGSRGGTTGVGGPVTASGGTQGAAPGQQEFEGEVRITADPATNSLIINASPQDFETIKQVIEKLDVRRRQVYVEAIILEVDLDKSRALGFSFQGAAGLGQGVGLGLFNPAQGVSNVVANPAQLLSAQGLILAAASSQTVRLPNGAVVPAQSALFQALQTDSDFNILSAPNILTTDNQEAEIVSGRNLPFLASTSTNETNLANTFSTIERRDVGITLRITPQISEGGTVRLDIFEEVSDITDVPGINASQLGPATTIRSATTTVVARDGQTVVIGGLISDTIRNSQSKIPFIGDIPVLGNLVNNRNTSRNKINLLIFLTPHIVRDANDQAKFSKIERGKMQAFMEGERIPNKRRDVLQQPSWDLKNLPPEPKRGERGGGDVPVEAPVPEAETAAPAYGDGNTGYASRPTITQAEQPASAEPVDYVLLASIWEAGQPPASLISTNGLLPLALPEGSDLTRLFQAGQQYRFQSDTFAAVYQCLQTFPSASAAFALYPEGLQVSTDPPLNLHWHELRDASAQNVVAWTKAQ